MIFKPSSLHKLFFTYICPRFYGGAPATPSNTTTTSTVNQSPWQNPVYQALMLGTKDKPGPITSMLRSSAEQTAAYNDMLKGGYSPVPNQAQYSGYSAPIKAPTDFSSAPATPAYTLPATTLAPAAPTGPNAIVNDRAAKGGIMSLKGYADGGDTAKDEGYKLTKATQTTAVQTKIDKALDKQKRGKALSTQETDLVRAYNTNEQMGGYGTITMVNGKPQLGPPAQGTMTQTDYTKLLTAFTQAGYTLPANVAKNFPSVKSVAEQTASENLKNTIGTANTSVLADSKPKYEQIPVYEKDPDTGKDTNVIKKDPDTGKDLYKDSTNIIGYESTNADFLAIQKAARELKTPEQFGVATGMYGRSSAGLEEAAKYKPTDAQAAQLDRASVRDIAAKKAEVERYRADMMNAPSDISAQNYQAALADLNQMQGPQSWIDQGTSEAYMSPYMQNVVDIQKRESNRDYAKQLQELNKQATAAGAFGGSRQAIERSEAARNQATKLADIQAQGQQQAYTSGMGQFSAEQGLGLQAGQANLTAAQQTAQQNQTAVNQQRSQYVQQALEAAKNNYGGQLTAAQQNQIAQNAASQFNASAQNLSNNNYVQQDLVAQQANQGMDFNVGQLNTNNQQATNLANQQAGLTANQQGIAALQGVGQNASGLTNTGTAANQAGLANLGAQGQVAQAEQALSQSGLDKLQGTANTNLNFVNQANAGVVAGVNSQPVRGGTSAATDTSNPANAFGARGGLIRNGKVSKRGKK